MPMYWYRSENPGGWEMPPTKWQSPESPPKKVFVDFETEKLLVGCEASFLAKENTADWMDNLGD